MMGNREPLTAQWRVTLVGAVVNLFLIGLKLLAGIWGRSQALIADAIHSVSDLFTDTVVLFGLWRGRKPPDDRHPFGHGRIETLTTTLVGLSLIATAVYLGYESLLQIYLHEAHHPTGLALVGAAGSLCAKEGLYHFTKRVGKRTRSQLILANAWHHRSDALSSIAVFLGVAGARFNPDWYLLDSLAALIVSFFIIKVGLGILAKSLNELMDAAPDAAVIEAMIRCAGGVDGVLGVHDLKVRMVAGRYQVEIHVVVDAEQTVRMGHRIAKNVETCLLRDIEGAEKVIVHVDPTDH